MERGRKRELRAKKSLEEGRGEQKRKRKMKGRGRVKER